MSKKILLAMAVVAMLAVPAMALPPVHTTVTFQGANPDIMVMSQATLKAGYSDFRETSLFTLTGTGDAVGGITASTGTYHCCTTLPKASLSGGYTASNGDFQSMFEASNLNWKSNPSSNTVPVLASATFFSRHNLSATGLPNNPITIDPSGAVSGGSMNVSGNASAICGRCQPLSAGQSFDGKAVEVEVSAQNVRNEMIVDSDLHPILDVGNFTFSAASDMVTVDVDGSAYGSSPINFGGQTGGQYRTQTDAPANNSSLRSSSLDYDVWLQKPQYLVYPNPLAADLYVYAPGASSMPINSWTTTLPKPEVWGDGSYSYSP